MFPRSILPPSYEQVHGQARRIELASDRRIRERNKVSYRLHDVNRGDVIILLSQTAWVAYSLYSRAAASTLPPVWVMAGANAVLIKPLEPLHLLSTVDRLCEMHGDDDSATAASADILRLIEIGQRQHELLTDTYRQILEALLDALESRDSGTSAHSRRVSAYATRLTLELDPSLLDDPTLEWGFLLHDIGKIGIPDQVLLKRGPLDPDERRCIERHPVIGHRMIGHIPFVQGRGIEVIRSHHERWDGLGYPDGLAAERIPLAARIFSVADTLDAMTDTRPYREPFRWSDAIDEVVRMRGTQFDPDVVDALVGVEPDLKTSHETHPPVAVH